MFEQIIGEIIDLIAYLRKRKKSNDIIKVGIFEELQTNLTVLSHKNRKDVDFNAIIDIISNEAIKKAKDENFNFNLLKKGKGNILEHLIYQKRLNKYIGWDCEKMILSISNKIDSLKLDRATTKERDIEKAQINLMLKLNNLYEQMRLLVIFIKSKNED